MSLFHKIVNAPDDKAPQNGIPDKNIGNRQSADNTSSKREEPELPLGKEITRILAHYYSPK